MKKKYTMEEFKKMFDEAKKESLKNILKNEELKKANDPMIVMMITMTTMSGIDDLEKILFKENGNE